MRGASFRIAFLFLLAGVSASSLAQGKILIKNGSFEKPLVAEGSLSTFNVGQKFSSWLVVGDSGNVELIGENFQFGGFDLPAAKGKQWLDLTGSSTTTTGVQQTVSTDPGKSYTLIFSVGTTNNPGGVLGFTSKVNVLIDGKLLDSVKTNSGQGNQQTWERFKLKFKAKKGKTTIAFFNADPSSDSNNGLDDVSLVEGAP